jgi:hypothetical protein
MPAFPAKRPPRAAPDRLGTRRRREGSVALGGNDALRGLPVEQLRENLTIAERTNARGIASMHGSAAEFRPGLHGVVPPDVWDGPAARGGLIPFLLDGGPCRN